MSPPERPRSARDIATFFVDAVGWEKSLAAVDEAVRALRLNPESLSDAAMAEILKRLANQAGPVGVTARFLVARAPLVDEGASRPTPVARVTKPTPRSEASSLTRAQLIALLAPSLGVSKAEEAFSAACASLGVKTDTYSAQDARSIFEHLATVEGLVGVTARFAKARLALLLPALR